MKTMKNDDDEDEEEGEAEAKVHDDEESSQREREESERGSKGDGNIQTKQMFRLVSPGTMQNSASNSKAVRQSATSLFARESSRFLRG